MAYSANDLTNSVACRDVVTLVRRPVERDRLLIVELGDAHELLNFVTSSSHLRLRVRN